MRENIKLRCPEYFKEFRCIGGMCEDNCCGGWDIHIDKTTFEQYKKIQDKRTNKYVNKNVFIRDNCKNINIDYGQIKLKDNKCPFLDKDRYCSIQLKLGEEYLSSVCATFPRIINKIDDYYEMSLDISCIEAARIILLKREGIEFEEAEGTLGKHAISVSIITDDKAIKDTNLKYIKEIRDISIKIIKNRKFELSERLYILGSFLEIIRKELCYDYNNVVQFINRYNIDFFGGEFKRNRMNYMLQLSFFRDMLEKLNIFEGNYSDYFKERMKEVMLGFRFNEHESLMENSDAFLKAYDICKENIFRNYSYIFENYLVNHMFKELFPFSESDILINDYIMMLIRFSYIRFYIVGQYLYKGTISIDDIIRFIQSLTKEIEHDKTYLSDILQYVKENELDNRRFATILL
ncbi:flagellin lysine-N-methylase [Clostridium sp. BL-8]|uniref:flagellin lysine-N-methylase n=1 Tax=Clostridium sp. BL-8 TaxID=349938 RepID=UPI00098C3927|nr:flagellin lysine-N-methylase [Clostridium sp. BL-8]OOM73949.1 flagellar biosynthetic protein FliU [Clostridium sp. BL-8]